MCVLTPVLCSDVNQSGPIILEVDMPDIVQAIGDLNEVLRVQQRDELLLSKF